MGPNYKFDSNNPINPITQNTPSTQIPSLNPNKKYTNTSNIKSETPIPTPQVNEILEVKKVENDPTTRIDIKRNIKKEEKPKEEIKKEIKKEIKV